MLNPEEMVYIGEGRVMTQNNFKKLSAERMTRILDHVSGIGCPKRFLKFMEECLQEKFLQEAQK